MRVLIGFAEGIHKKANINLIAETSNSDTVEIASANATGYTAFQFLQRKHMLD